MSRLALRLLVPGFTEVPSSGVGPCYVLSSDPVRYANIDDVIDPQQLVDALLAVQGPRITALAMLGCTDWDEDFRAYVWEVWCYATGKQSVTRPDQVKQFIGEKGDYRKYARYCAKAEAYSRDGLLHRLDGTCLVWLGAEDFNHLRSLLPTTVHIIPVMKSIMGQALRSD